VKKKNRQLQPNSTLGAKTKLRKWHKHNCYNKDQEPNNCMIASIPQFNFNFNSNMGERESFTSSEIRTSSPQQNWQSPSISDLLTNLKFNFQIALPSIPNQTYASNTWQDNTAAVPSGTNNRTNNNVNNSLVTNTFAQFLIDDKKPYALNARLGVHTNCILAVEEFLKGALTPEQIAKIDRTQLVSDSKVLEEAISGAPGALYDAGIVGELVKFRGAKNEQEKLAYLQNFASQINKLEGALIKTDKVSKPAGHEAVATNFKVIKDSSGNITDVTWQDVSTRAPGSEGLSKKIFSLRKDFLDTGDRFTFGILKPEIIAQIEKKYSNSTGTAIASGFSK
jgi:hypothetical protein